ncbi:MAG: gamma-glutamyltransferase family protein [Desulfobacterales bacterium]|nr:gamma-glutamyltransferase family protein [Desulfobacterales bacterium]
MTMSWQFPYPSQRMPVMARNVVATSQPLAAQAGLQMLQQGGNAVDAALATAITLTVVEPTSNGIGSDAFALVWDGENLHGLNGSGRSPRAWTPDRFAAFRQMPNLGWDAVTVPGAVEAWVQLSRKFGSLPFEKLFEPAINYAENGYVVSPITADRWSSTSELYREFPEFRATFFLNGRAPHAGERFCCPDQAATLRSIAASQGESFYRGDLAQKIVACSQAAGGAMSLEDLAEHQSQWVNPISIRYRNVRLHEIPPNGQGLAALIALGILREFDMGRYAVDSADSFHLQLEAMKIALAEAYRHIADSSSMQIEPEQLLADNFLKRRAMEIRMDRASRPVSDVTADRGTVYLTTADESGMLVSFIQSNYLGFGSGIVIPGTGISMHNRGFGFVLKPDHPNCVDGYKRPFHTIIPGFVTKDGQALMSFGVMGGSMQAQGHVQMMVRIFDYGQNPQAASDAPRWHVDENFAVALEAGISPDTVTDLKSRGQVIIEDAPTHVFGGAQLIYRLEDGYCAASDHRKDGAAVGY